MVPVVLVRVSAATITSFMRYALAAIFLFVYSAGSLAGDDEAMDLREEIVLAAVDYAHER